VVCGHISQYDSDGGVHTPITTGLPDFSECFDVENFPQALLHMGSPMMRTAPPRARSPGTGPRPLSNRQLAAASLPVRAPRFNLVRAPRDPYLSRTRVQRAHGGNLQVSDRRTPLTTSLSRRSHSSKSSSTSMRIRKSSPGVSRGRITRTSSATTQSTPSTRTTKFSVTSIGFRDTVTLTLSPPANRVDSFDSTNG
jgi:hypothetical protein